MELAPGAQSQARPPAGVPALGLSQVFGRPHQEGKPPCLHSAGHVLDAASPGVAGSAAATAAATAASDAASDAASGSLYRTPSGRPAWHPSRVLVRFKATAAAATAAAAQARSPLPGLRLKRLAGEHHAVPVPSQLSGGGAAGVASAAAAGGGASSIPPDAVFVFEVTNGTVAEAVKRLRANPRECAACRGGGSTAARRRTSAACAAPSLLSEVAANAQ